MKAVVIRKRRGSNGDLKEILRNFEQIWEIKK
jgi:hypothetical protein